MSHPISDLSRRRPLLRRLVQGSLLAAALAAAGAAGAAVTATPAALQRARALVTKLSGGKATALQVAPGPGGLVGVEVQEGKRKFLIWMTPDGQAMIPGSARVVGIDGTDYNQAVMVKLGLMPKPLAPASAAIAAAQAPSFIVGTHGPLIVVFVDPNCIFCHKMLALAMPHVRAGTLRLRVVPVGFLKPDSEGKAEAIMAAPDPAKALARDEQKFNVKTEEGGIAPAASPSPKVVSEIKSNTTLLGRTGEIATPTIVYCDRGGKAHVMHGIEPTDAALQQFLSEVGPMQRGGSCARS